MPSAFLEMDDREKAFTIAAINIKIEKDKKEKKRTEAKARTKKKGR